MVVPEAGKAVPALMRAVGAGGVAQSTLELVHPRAGQINGCGVCVVGGVRSARKAGVDEDRLVALAAWRETPFFTDAERLARLDLRVPGL